MSKKTLSIPDQINRDYRKYALYVIQSRGIPNFYDCITPVQRLIIQNAPTVFSKTVGVIGGVFSTELYHHGDASLASAISKLARPFGCSEQVLEGDGFFGTPANPRPAGPRYTSVRIASKYKTIVDQYKDLNVLNEEGGHDWLHVTNPIGLATHIVGIAVGYSSNILPRKPDEVEAYLAGDFSKKLKPYFKGFKGKISQVDGLRSAWLLEGEFVANKSARTIEIQSLSPLSRYDTFITKLGLILESKGVDYRIENRSKEEVEVLIKLKCSDEQFDDVATRVKKETQKIVTENIVLVKDGLVMEYDNIQEYLDQFRVHREEVIYKRIVKDLYYNDRELAFQEAKLKFLVFMQAKKRLNDEIVEFLKQYESWIKTRLEAIALVRLSEKEIEATKSRIEELKSNAIVLKKSIKEQGDKWQGIKKAWEKATKSKPKQSALVATSSTDTFNGIEIWNPEEAIEEDVEESVEGDETNEN
jgi:DNA gyrase/topoisomerase IV subunit A